MVKSPKRQVVPSRPDNSMAFVALAYILIFLVQTARTLYIDAYDILGGTFDLTGYAINTFLGMTLTYYALTRKIIRIGAATGIAIFTALVVYRTTGSIQYELISVVFSRYGIVSWLCIGGWMAIAFQALRVALERNDSDFLKISCYSVAIVAMFPLAFLVVSYLAARVTTPSYQPVANNSMVLIMVYAIFAQTLIRVKMPGSVMMQYAIIILSCFLVYTVALVQSTAIVAFWIMTMPILLISTSSKGSKIEKWISIALIIVVIYGLTVLLFLGDLLKETRFGEINENIFALSSVQNRLEIARDFLPQFSVSPLLGDFDAELAAGFAVGSFMHSLPLSLLTHTGIIGFLIFSGTLASIISEERSDPQRLEVDRLLTLRLFGVIALAATAFAFFTWLPLWFFMG